jgi:hypothetical protein
VLDDPAQRRHHLSVTRPTQRASVRDDDHGVLKRRPGRFRERPGQPPAAYLLRWFGFLSATTAVRSSASTSVSGRPSIRALSSAAT